MHWVQGNCPVQGPKYNFSRLCSQSIHWLLCKIRIMMVAHEDASNEYVPGTEPVSDRCKLQMLLPLTINLTVASDTAPTQGMRGSHSGVLDTFITLWIGRVYRQPWAFSTKQN